MTPWGPMLVTDVVWDDFPFDAAVRAVVLFEQADNPGMLVIARAMSDGVLYGAREIVMGDTTTATTLGAWLDEARVNGWPVVDMRGSGRGNG